MDKRLAVIKQSMNRELDDLMLIRGKNGGRRELFEISPGEPLQKSPEHIDGLLMIGSHVNVYEQQQGPMHAHLGT